MQLRRAAGILHIVTAFFTGYWGLRMMFAPFPSGSFFWWPLTMFGAPILLLIGGILTLFPRMKKIWLIAIAGTIVLGVWVAFLRDFDLVFWVFAASVALATYGILALTSALRRNWLSGLVASLALAISWIPMSVEVLAQYLSPQSKGWDPPLLLSLVLAPWILILASIVAASILSKSPEPESLGQSFARPPSTAL